jgi:hypothetical protein
MVLSVLALLVLILVTTVLYVRPPSTLVAQPSLTVGMAENKTWFIVDLSAAVERYQYRVIRLMINGTDTATNWTFQGTLEEREAYGLHRWVPANATFSMNVYFVDRQRNYFEYNVTARAIREPSERTVMVFTFPFEPAARNTEVRKTPPDEDYRLGVPWRGTLK